MTLETATVIKSTECLKSLEFFSELYRLCKAQYDYLFT